METMRGHGEGSLFQRKSGPGRGQWVAVVTMRDGKRASRWAPDKDRDEAKVQLVELLRLRDAAAPITRRIRLSDYLERWVNDSKPRAGQDSGFAPSTWRKHESLIRVHVVPRLGHIRLSELSASDIATALRDAERGGLARRSVAHLRATLRRSLSDAYRDGLIERNPASLVRGPRIPHRERTILDATQARRLIEGTRGTRYGPLWTILVTTGLRISEALGLAWSDVDYGGNDAVQRGAASRPDVAAPMAVVGTPSPQAAGLPESRPIDRAHGLLARDAVASRPVVGPSVTVRRQLARENGEWVHRPPKTAKGRRTVPLTPLGVEALRARRRDQDADLGARPRPIDGLVFTSPTGAPLHETNTLKALQADLHAAGLPRVTQHDLRHSAATVLYSMGVPLESIADMLGHSSVRVTQDLYRHRVPELQRTAADRMQEALG